jgi:hypothetical protein
VYELGRKIFVVVIRILKVGSRAVNAELVLDALGAQLAVALGPAGLVQFSAVGIVVLALTCSNF